MPDFTISINPFGSSNDGIDNIFILDSEGSGVAIICKHPVWKHLDKLRMQQAKLLCAAPRMLELLQSISERRALTYSDEETLETLLKELA